MTIITRIDDNNKISYEVLDIDNVDIEIKYNYKTLSEDIKIEFNMPLLGNEMKNELFQKTFMEKLVDKMYKIKGETK